MRCEGLTALQAADFSIGGNGGKVKQQCARSAMSSGGHKGAGTGSRACGRAMAGCPHKLPGTSLPVPARPGRGPALVYGPGRRQCFFKGP